MQEKECFVADDWVKVDAIANTRKTDVEREHLAYHAQHRKAVIGCRADKNANDAPPKTVSPLVSRANSVTVASDK